MRKCVECAFFNYHEADRTQKFGWCHRFPPQVLKNEDGSFTSACPTVAEENGCGEFERKQEPETQEAK